MMLSQNDVNMFMPSLTKNDSLYCKNKKKAGTTINLNKNNVLEHYHLLTNVSCCIQRIPNSIN